MDIEMNQNPVLDDIVAVDLGTEQMSSRTNSRTKPVMLAKPSGTLGSSSTESVVELPDGSSYAGQWRESVQEGKGVLVTPDGGIYRGQFQEGQRHGDGFWKSAPSKESLDPDHVKMALAINIDEQDETQKLTTLPGQSAYLGQWHCGEQHGFGKERDDRGQYEGQFRQGKWHGSGSLQTPFGSTYEGEFTAGQLEGHGKYVFPDGRQYIGQWQRSRMHGVGRMEWKDGSVFTGNWKRGTAQGPAVHTDADGTKREVEASTV